jgi:hypothetical protein
MADICTFGVEVSGDSRQVQALKEYVERGVVALPDANYEKYILRIDLLYDDLQDEEHEFIWLDNSTPCPKNDQFAEAEGPFWFTTDRRRMVLHGTAKWAPPGPLVERLSRAFPDLDFTYGGTTEHTVSEHWTCKAGVSKCEWYVEQDIQADKEKWHVRDGQPVRPLEWIDADQEDITALEAKANELMQR